MDVVFDAALRCGDLTWIAFAEQPQLRGRLRCADSVRVHEPRTREHGTGLVAEVTDTHLLVAVDWASLEPARTQLHPAAASF